MKKKRLFGFGNLFRDSYERRDVVDIRETPTDANVVISATSNGRRDKVLHAPCFDLDYECYLVRSKTPGHFHLYLNKEVTWDKYVAVLDAMVDAGLLEKGWVRAAKHDGFAVLRLPPEQLTYQMILDDIDRGQDPLYDD